MDHLESNNLLSDTQFGYKKKQSTDIATTLFVDNIRKNIDIGKLVGAIFIDLTKAFDTLAHVQQHDQSKSYCNPNSSIHFLG